MISLSSGDERWLPELVAGIRQAEHLAARPSAILVDIAEATERVDLLMRLIESHQLEDVDFLVVSGSRGGAGLTRLQELLRDNRHDVHLIAKFDQAQDFADVEGLVGSAYGVLITEAGLRSLSPSEAPIAQKKISRQCQIAAKPCLVARSALKGTNVRSSSELAEVFDLANLAFSSRVQTARMMCLDHGVISRHISEQLDAESLLNTADMLAKELEIAVPGDRIIVVSGHPNQTQDQANGFIVETIA